MKLSAMTAQDLSALVKEWKETDLKLDRTHSGGYFPSKEVLKNRVRTFQKDEIDAMGAKLFGPSKYASEHEGDKGVWVTYRDNRNMDKWREKMEELLAVAKKAGYKTRVRNDAYVVLYDQKRVKEAEKLYDSYLKELAKAGSKGARKELKLPEQSVYPAPVDFTPVHKQKEGDTVYEVVGFSKPIRVKSKAELIRVLKKAGVKPLGIHSNPRQRAELQGQPKFEGLLGPMYGGKGVIRYETEQAFNKFSAKAQYAFDKISKAGDITREVLPIIGMTEQEWDAVSASPARTKVVEEVRAILASKLSAAKDTGTSKKDPKRKASLEGVLAQAAKLRENVSLEDFPEVGAACSAVEELEALASDLAEAQVKLRAAKSKTEEAKEAQAALDQIRNKIDAMLPPLSAVMSSMERMVLATAALASKLMEVSNVADGLGAQLKGEKERLASLAKAVESTAKM